MSFSVLKRIDRYRESLLSTTSTQSLDDQHHPPPNDESGAPHGDGGGQAPASGVTSVTSS
jgi:hypothetical protein